MKRGLLFLPLPVLFLLGVGIAMLVGGPADTGFSAGLKDAEETRSSAAEVTPSPVPVAQGPGTKAVDEWDCSSGLPDPSAGAHGSTGAVSKPSDPPPSGPADPGGSDGDADQGADEDPVVKPPGHPGTDPDVECPRSRSGSTH